MKQRITGLGEIGLNTDIGPSLLPANAVTSAFNVVTADESLRTVVGEHKLFNLAIPLSAISLGPDSWANIDAIEEPLYWDVWEMDDVTGSPPDRNYDDTPAEIGDAVYWDGGNWINEGPIANANIWVEPLYHTSYIDFEQKQWIIVSNGFAVVAFDMFGLFEIITPAELLTAGFLTFTDLNGILVVNSNKDGPYYWPGPGNALQTLPGWDPTWLCEQMVSYKYYLIALRMTEGLGEYPHKIRWSNSAQEGELPVEWAITQANDAGSDILGETPGIIMGAQLVRDKLFIVKEDGVYQMRWIGGQYIMDISRLQGTIGTTAPRGWAELKGALAIFTSTDLLIFDGQKQTSLTDKRVRRGLFGSISEELWELSQLYYHSPTTTLYISTVSAGNTQLSQAIVYNGDDNTFGHKRLNYSYGFDTAYVSVTTGIPVWDDLGPPAVPAGPQPAWIVGEVWDEQTDGTWNKGRYQPSIPDILEYESNGRLSNDPYARYWVSVMALSNTDYDDNPKYCEAMRIGIPVEGTNELAQINEFWFELSGDADVVINVGSQDTPNGVITWARNKDSGIDFPVSANQSQVVDPIITGRFIAWRISSQAVGHWRLHSITADWEKAGDR